MSKHSVNLVARQICCLSPPGMLSVISCLALAKPVPTGLGHTYTAAGSYQVVLTVRDNAGAIDATTTTVTAAQGKKSLPDPSTLAMVGSGLAAGLFYIGLSRLRRRLSRS